MSANWFTTYAVVPSGVIALPRGLGIAIGAPSVPVKTSMGVSVSPLRLDT